MVALLILCWVVLGAFRAVGTAVLNDYATHGLSRLIALETWNAFLQPHFLRWSALCILAGLLASLAPRALRIVREPNRQLMASAIAASVAFWGLAALGEILERTPVRDMMTSRIVLSTAHLGIVAIAAAGVLLSIGIWTMTLRSGSTRPLRAGGLAIVLVFAVLGLTRLWASAQASQGSARPNVLIVTIDALRADHLPSYGYSRMTSPRIEALAAASTVYERSISPASSTRPSMAAMLTSVYPTEFSGRPFKYIPYNLPTVAEVFLNAGYRTGAVVSNVWLKSPLGFDQGFEDYDQQSAMSEFYADTGRVHWKNASHVSDAGITLLQRYAGAPFFLWLHYLDPHHPYEPEPPFDKAFSDARPDHERLTRHLDELPTDQQTKYLSRLGADESVVPDETFQAVIDQYDGEIAYTDMQVGRVLDALERLGVAENTVIVVTADHGEEFRDHRGWGHGHTLHQEVIHVPLIVRYPGEAGGKRVASLVQTLDIAPTVLAVSGLAVPPTMRGMDLRRVAQHAERPAISYSVQGKQLSVEIDGWKLITARSDKDEGEASLYHIAEDPFERNDLGGRESGRVAEMLAVLFERVGPRARERLTESITGIDPDTRKQLEALGYLN